MKESRVILFFILFSFCYDTASQTKKALIIAVSEYEDFRNWKRISSVEDIPFIRAGLHKFGFTDDHIDTLKDEAATRVGILKGLDRLAANSNKGDIVVFYFCGHGQQIMDNNGEPDEQDGYDEALVPFDAKGQYNPTGYTGENHLRDDELNEKLKAIYEKIGPNGNLLVMIDACHSGSATRADAFRIARGSAKPFASQDYKPSNTISIPGTKGFSEKAVLPNMIMISASGPDQLNYQTKDDAGKNVGSLSFAFAKTCFEMQPGDNYSLMFEKIKARIQANQPTQVPILEGDGSRKVFSGEFTKGDDIIAVNNAQWINDTAFWFNRGYLNDITEGSQFHLAVLGSAGVAVKGYITRVEALQSLGVVSKNVDRKKGYSLVVDEILPSDMVASVFIEKSGANKNRAEALSAQIKQFSSPYPWIKWSDPADMMIGITTGAQDTVSVVDKNGKVVSVQYLLPKQALSQDSWKAIMKSINDQLRIGYIRNLPDGGALAKGVTAQVVADSKKKDPEAGEFIFREDDEFSLSIDNQSGRTVYYTLINITPGNEVKVLIPYDQKPPADCQLRDKSVYTTPLLSISKGTPSGKEIFKIILSDQPIDLRPMIEKLSKKPERAGMASFEKLFDDMYSEEESHLNKKRDISKLEIDKTGVLTIGYTIAK